jgi:transcriptional regulator with XRE-family HTH domain
MKTSSERRQINGEWVKAMRKRLGLTQEVLAERAGVSRPAVARWELGTFRPSKLAGKALLAFADANRHDLGDLAEGLESPLTGLKRRGTQRSQRRSSHEPSQRSFHPGTAQRKPH